MKPLAVNVVNIDQGIVSYYLILQLECYQVIFYLECQSAIIRSKYPFQASYSLRMCILLIENCPFVTQSINCIRLSQDYPYKIKYCKCPINELLFTKVWCRFIAYHPTRGNRVRFSAGRPGKPWDSATTHIEVMSRA